MPLHPMRIVILREPHRAEPLRAALNQAGFDVIVRPVTRIEFVGPQGGDDWPRWTQTADWVVFTSLNGVEGFAAGLGGPKPAADVLYDRDVAAFGATSVQKLGCMGVSITVRKERGTSAELAAALSGVMKPESTVLYPCAETVTPTFTEALCEAGHHLRQVVCYRTAAIPVAERVTLDWRAVDAAFVAAPSAVHALCDEVELSADLGFYAIGPTTAAALRKSGRKILGVAEAPNVASIVSMLRQEC